MVSNKPYHISTGDGAIVGGFHFGAYEKAIGELVFTTSMTGYVESLTDPSYKGQILIFTHPLIGNYGVPKKRFCKYTDIVENFESGGIQVEGVVVSEFTSGMRWDSESTFESWLKKNNVPGMYGVDTREL
ncbi:carbamoyl phosphate synthase small subunit, partial [mine drainage metagenome]